MAVPGLCELTVSRGVPKQVDDVNVSTDSQAVAEFSSFLHFPPES